MVDEVSFLLLSIRVISNKNLATGLTHNFQFIEPFLMRRSVLDLRAKPRGSAILPATQFGSQFSFVLLMVGLLLVCTAYLVDGSFSPFLYFRF